VEIAKVVQESSNIRSFFFSDKLSLLAQAGQFEMVWLPGVGEFPMSLSLKKGKLSSIAVKAMGEGSKRLYEVKGKELIGLRGPYGRPFWLDKNLKSVLLVGGGTGMAPIINFAESVSKTKKTKAKIVVGARTKGGLPFLRAATQFVGAKNVFPTTDDGSFGFKGLAHQEVKELMKEDRFDAIFCCGPERMMFEVHKIAVRDGIPIQLSLERIMKCGIGICGSCCIGDLVLCRDGPVLDSLQVSGNAHEFGHLERDYSGKLVPK
jgi:dihydroorotate dehydrogenase electron transfer subunit